MTTTNLHSDKITSLDICLKHLEIVLKDRDELRSKLKNACILLRTAAAYTPNNKVKSGELKINGLSDTLIAACDEYWEAIKKTERSE